MDDWVPSEGAQRMYAALAARLPPSVQDGIDRMLAQWPGRMAVRSIVAVHRVEVFDRSMALAAQAFTSVIPILIVTATWLGVTSKQVAEVVSLPEQVQPVLDQAVGHGSGSQVFGVIGSLAVLASATSFSRALTRAFAAIWGLPRPRLRLTSAWRWIAVVGCLTVTLVIDRAAARFLSTLPVARFWETVAAFGLDVAVSLLVPVLLLAGTVRTRLLLPGALLFGMAMVLVRPASEVWLPHALVVSAERYGAIGVAFSYIAWLYVLSFCLLVTGILGQVAVTDEGRFGTRLRGTKLPGAHPAVEETGTSMG